MNKIVGIYKITNPKGAVYIGESKDIESRWNRDYKNLRCKAQRKLYNSFITYGFENHTFEIIKECKEEEIPYYERHYQEYYNVLDREYGLNLKLTKIGEKKQVQSEESKQKNRESNKKLYENGYVNPMQGKKRIDNIERNKLLKTGTKHSEETLRKMSESKKGLPKTELHKEKLKQSSYWAKKVININTSEVYNSAKEAWELNKDVLRIAYPTFKDRLNGNSKTYTHFKYI